MSPARRPRRPGTRGGEPPEPHEPTELPEPAEASAATTDTPETTAGPETTDRGPTADTAVAAPGPEMEVTAPRPETEVAPPSSEEAAGSHSVDLVPDELMLARSQLDSGLPALAEGTVRRRIDRLEADGARPDDELDALRLLLAEALWRQGRPAAARAALDALRPGSPQRRMPIAMLVEAEALAAAGEPDRAAGVVERVIASVGIDAAHELRAGVPGRLAWPLPGELQPEPPSARPPWAPPAADNVDEPGPGDERTADGRRRLEHARVAYVAGDLGRGDAEMSIAVRLDPTLAADGVAIMEPTLGGQPLPDRLLLYGDLLRAAGRGLEADRAYVRAAERGD